MLKIGDRVFSSGSEDRWGRKVSCTSWTLVSMGKIVDPCLLHSFVAYGEHFGQPVWLSGSLDPVGIPGHPPEKIRLGESEVSTLEASARDIHRERMSGDFL